MGAYWTCGECLHYNPEKTNSRGWGYCTERFTYYPFNDRACSNKFEHKLDYVPSGCFLTTAICNIFGFEDDCFGLETMRNFRDNILVKDSKYYHLLASYEIIGPVISHMMYNDPYRKEVAEYYFDNYIYDILIDLVNNTNHEKVVDRYIEMGNDMKRMYGITKEVSEEDIKVLTKRIENNQYKVKNKNK